MFSPLVSLLQSFLPTGTPPKGGLILERCTAHRRAPWTGGFFCFADTGGKPWENGGFTRKTIGKR